MRLSPAESRPLFSQLSVSRLTFAVTGDMIGGGLVDQRLSSIRIVGA
jgi:hypothetical protein